MKNMHSYVIGLQDIDKTSHMIVGGKGASLGELCQVKGVKVPGGFCISTEAYKQVTRQIPIMNELLDALSLLKIEEIDKINTLCDEIRRVIEAAAMPGNIIKDIAGYLTITGENKAYAIRSSATAEDLPAASFAGQQDTYLNITGKQAILQHISKCWASLFTGRAVIYRIQNGFDHRKVFISVIVQQMVFPQAAGVLFTADPVNGNRKVSSVDAVFGLGEALVSGIVNADNYKVCDESIIEKKIPEKKLAVYALAGGGVEKQAIEPLQQNMAVLTDEQVLQLVHIGKKIELHFGQPQDIEWCLENDVLYIVQSRPITTLFPVPEAADEERHVYISVGHQQMMTDPLKPLGLSLWQLTASRPMFKAGGRLFVDVAQNLASAAGRDMLLQMMGQHDPLIKDALITIIERDYISIPLKNNDTQIGVAINKSNNLPGEIPVDNDPAIIAGLIKRSEEAVNAIKQHLQTKSGLDVFDCITEDMEQRKKLLADPLNMGVIMAAINASIWLNKKIEEWLEEKNVSDALTQSAPGNITSRMGLDLMDLADVIRPYPAVIEYLQQTNADNFLNELEKLDGGQQTRDAIVAYLEKYGMRCAGEIDITNTRWAERPVILVPMILNNIKNFAPGTAGQKFKQGLQDALAKKEALLRRLKQLPGGAEKAAETQQKIDLLRNFIGYREYPKYHIVSRYFVYKQALLKEAERLVGRGVILAKSDIYYLTFEELRKVVHTQTADYGLIDRRKEEHALFEKLNPPRVITSDGEIVTGAYKRENLPVNALVGLPVSAGVVEGRARVILRMEDAVLEDGDILVTAFTDPSWTPLFVLIKGLVTEVGGLMTHGAVIAREYGLPAIVGVENATKLIKDGQRVRLHGAEGYIEVL